MNLYIIKLGSSTLLQGKSIFDEIITLQKKGKKILIICGGAEAIQSMFKTLEKPQNFLNLENGDQVRYCPKEDMDIIIEAYKKIILSKLYDKLGDYNFYGQIAGDNGLVLGTQGKPLKVIKDNKKIIIRDSLYGQYLSCKSTTILSLFQQHDIVCLCPPIRDASSKNYLNIDADMLAANLAVDLNACHLRFVTSTPGVLKDIDDINSTIQDFYPEYENIVVSNRMKQKIRACKFAIANGSFDTAICGPHSMNEKTTWIWHGKNIPDDMKLLNQAVNIASISRDELILSKFLKDRCQFPNVTTSIDDVGNVVLTKGKGDNVLLLLGHIDTVPYIWPVVTDEEKITGRGCVDAKGSFINFIEVLKHITIPENGKLIVIGAVEEEISSSLGAFFVRDNYKVDAVIIGEPSGYENLTLGYFGLLKIQVTLKKPHKHSAGKGNTSTIDELFNAAGKIRQYIDAIDPDNISSIIELKHCNFHSYDFGKMVINFRISPKSKTISDIDIRCLLPEKFITTVLRNTPGYQSNRSNHLYKAFAHSFNTNLSKSAKPLLKKGTSDMNTLASSWNGIPMVAYGPGDSSLDHTDSEVLYFEEVRASRNILLNAVEAWFANFNLKEQL